MQQFFKIKTIVDDIKSNRNKWEVIQGFEIKVDKK